MAHVATITIDHTKVPGDLTDYVGLIVPDGSAGYSALYALCLEGGGDIRLFKSDDTTELAREIVSFSVSAETGEIHYRYAGTLSSSVDTPIHVYADGSSSDYAVGATYGRNAVWDDFAFVSHEGGGGTDSSGNATSAAQGGVTSGGVTGKIGDATDYDGSNDFFRVSGMTFASSGTISAWLKPSSISEQDVITQLNSNNSDRFIVQVSNDGADTIRIYNNINGRNQVIESGSASLNNGTYSLVHVSLDGSNVLIHVDGVQDQNVSSGNNFSQISPTTTGVGATEAGFANWDGDIDEFRIANMALSGNWRTTEYNNQNSYSTFYSVAAVAGGSAAQAARRGAVMMM